ncbi:YveK family protein [Paraclostridium bifermentans]|uniref:YveK family protein n=1 Tax=Paraclostridium bifermentans TaxID=1490 RepID=UPI00359C8315
MEETIDLRDYFQIIKKRAWIIALITIIAMLVSGIISFFVLSPVYEAKTTLLVDTDAPKDQSMTSDQIRVSEQLALTYGEIIKSRTVIKKVEEQLKTEVDKDNISIATVQETGILSIIVQGTNAKKVADIANTLPEVFEKEVKRITQANDVQIIDKAVVPKNPVKPNKIMNIAIAAVLGIMVSLFVIFLIEYLDNKIKTPQDIEQYLGLPIIGVVPDEYKSKKGGK